jgi:hypothetical protein
MSRLPIMPLGIVSLLLAMTVLPTAGYAQLAPEIGYVYPPGAQAGTTVDVKLGGYDWTPDMQVFVHDPRVKLESVGAPTAVLVPEPPYWFGAKGRGPAWPLPRELSARLTIPADVPPGPVRFQVANANGPSPPGVFFVGDGSEVVEQAGRKTPQVLPALPVAVNGQIRLIEEVDQYEFVAPKNGPLTIELFARGLDSPLHGMLKIHDDQGKLIADVADTEGRDLSTTFIARAGAKYVLRLHDLDFAGDRSYVYRVLFWPGPRVQAAYPAAGRRGQTLKVEFVGLGLATGANQLETVARDVAFPATDASSFQYVLETPAGAARPFKLLVSNLAEQVAAANVTELQAPCAITGTIATRFGTQSFRVPMKKGDKWQIVGQTAVIGSPLDIDLTLTDVEGKEVATNDDAPGTIEPLINYIAPADSAYVLTLTDRSGKSGDKTANYRLLIQPHHEGFEITAPTQLPVPLGGTAKLALKAIRYGGYKGAILVALAGLPQGVTAAANLSIPEAKDDLVIDLISQADAQAIASLATVTASAKLSDGSAITLSKSVLLATTMKPRIKITPEGLDDVRKVQRGSTFLAPLFIERLEGYQGPITLEMTAKQQRHRQGLASDEFIVPPDAKKVEYPIFVPEWMETTKTSRMILNGVVQVPDPKGNVRTLVQRMELRIGLLPLGALLKLASGSTGEADELSVRAGGEVQVPLMLFRAADFREPVQIELVPTDLPPGAFTAPPITLAADASTGNILLKVAGESMPAGRYSLLFRASAKKDGKWPVISETKIPLVVQPAQ